MFVGLYQRHGEKERTADDINSDPAVKMLLSYDPRPETRTRLWFDLRLIENEVNSQETGAVSRALE
jgi:hypothetical protein